MLDKQDDIDGGPKRNMTEMIGVPESRSGRRPERRRMARETEKAKRMVGRREARMKGGTISGTLVGMRRNTKAGMKNTRSRVPFATASRTAGGRWTRTTFFLIPS